MSGAWLFYIAKWQRDLAILGVFNKTHARIQQVCQRGSNFDNFFYLFLVDERIQIPL